LRGRATLVTSCSRSSSGALIVSPSNAFSAALRALTAPSRATLSWRIASTIPVVSLATTIEWSART